MIRYYWCESAQIYQHFSENVLLSMEKLIEYVCVNSKFYTHCKDSRKAFPAFFYIIKLV